MHLSTFLSALGFAGQALAISHPCFAHSRVSSGRSKLEIASDMDVKDYFSKLVPATKKTLLYDITGPAAGADVRFPFFFVSSRRVLQKDDERLPLQVGVVMAAIPDPTHPEFSVYWLRDACHVYHSWLNELTVLGDNSLRPMADDLTHALIRTQQVVNLAGNVFTGGLEEAAFDSKIEPFESEAVRMDSPAAGECPQSLESRVL